MFVEETEVAALLELPNEVSGEYYWNNTQGDVFLERAAEPIAWSFEPPTAEIHGGPRLYHS